MESQHTTGSLKPFMYAIADIEGNAVMDDICVAEHPSELELSDEDEGRGMKIVPVYTGPQIESLTDSLQGARLMVDEEHRRGVDALMELGCVIKERDAALAKAAELEGKLKISEISLRCASDWLKEWRERAHASEGRCPTCNGRMHSDPTDGCTPGDCWFRDNK